MEPLKVDMRQKEKQEPVEKTKIQLVLIVAAVFVLSFSILSLEIALTRIFSILVSYHYVFSIISMVLFGLGIGAMLIPRWRRWFPTTGYPINTMLFSLLIILSLTGIVALPLIGGTLSFNLRFWLLTVLAAVPFLAAGLAMAELYQEFAPRGSLLYGFDLLGGAAAALLIVVLLNRVGGPGAVMVSAAAAGLSSVLLLWVSRRPLWPAFAALGIVSALLVLSVTGVIRIRVPLFRDPNKEMSTMFANPKEKAELVDSRWSAFGRTDLVRSALTPNEMVLFVDGAAGTPMYNLKEILESPEEQAHLLLHFGEFFPFWFLEKEEKDSALIIGPGGGRDVVISLLGGVESITAVEVNPEIVQLVKEYEEFNGGIYTRIPNVKAVVEEGRKFLRSNAALYDLIMMALPVTKSSRSVEGYALTENYLYTVESMGDYLDHLTPEGRIVIVAHSNAEIYRLVVLAIEAFKAHGIDERDAMQHIYTLASGMMPTIVIKKEPFTLQEVELRHSRIHELGFDQGNFYVPFVRQVHLRPDERLGVDSEWRMFDQVLVDISTGQTTVGELIRAASIDITAVTDDRPFFYKFQQGLPAPFGTFFILIAVVTAGLVWLLLSSKKMINRSSFLKSLVPTPQEKPFLFIFFSLGVGFMLVEIAFFQKLMLFIGQPVLALTVLLFSLLVGVGAGSLLSARVHYSLKRVITIFAAIIGVVVIPYGLFLWKWFFTLGFDPRLTAVILLMPLGVLLGFPFPLTIRLMKETGLQSSVHRMWGVNGIASVLGSALAMIIGIQVGFTYSVLAGGLLYGGVAVAAQFFPQQKLTRR